MEEIKKLLKEGKLIIGTNKIIKNLKLGKLKEVYLSSNCPRETIEDIKHYARLNKVKVNELSENNKQLGVVCRKPFSVSVLGY